MAVGTTLTHLNLDALTDRRMMVGSSPDFPYLAALLVGEYRVMGDFGAGCFVSVGLRLSLAQGLPLHRGASTWFAHRGDEQRPQDR